MNLTELPHPEHIRDPRDESSGRSIRFRFQGWLALVICSLFGSGAIQAKETISIWDGSSDARWAQPKNWIGGLPFERNDTAAFTGIFGIGGTAIRLIGNQTTGTLLISTGTDFSISDATLKIATGNITRTAITGTTTLNSSITMEADGTWAICGNLLANGIVAGDHALTKSESGTLTLSNANTYSGATTVLGGKLVVGPSGTINSSSGVSIGAGEFNYNSTTALTRSVTFSSIFNGILSGTGTLAPAVLVTSGNMYTPGTVDGTGQQSLANGITFNPGSVFSWNLDVTSATTELHDSALANSLAGSGAEFRIVLGSGDTMAAAFWDTNHQWSAAELFGSNNSNVDLSNIFNSTDTLANFNSDPTQGCFSFGNIGGGAGNMLAWTAVPEPSSALAGLLLAAGLHRRRRPCRPILTV